MTDLLIRFGLYNLFPGMIIGVLVWLVIYAATSLMKIEYVPLKLPLFYASLMKSSLVILGISSSIFQVTQLSQFLPIRPIPFKEVLPVFVFLVVVVWLIQYLLAMQNRRLILAHSSNVDQSSSPLLKNLERVLDAYRQQGCVQINHGWICCEVRGNLPTPKLLLSKNIHSPLITLSGGDPLIIIPQELSNQLSDSELEGALAHELAHLALRSPAWCSSSLIARMAGVNPIAWLLAAYLHLEEEKACDDMAIIVLEQPETYVEMLIKSYRFANKQQRGLTTNMQWASHLLGIQPSFFVRARRILEHSSPAQNLGSQRLSACLVWVIIFALLFI